MQNDTTQPAAHRKIPFEPLLRWFFNWRVLRRFVAGIAILVTLVALFYAEEDWRGKRAWEKYKHEMESKGVVLDWAAYIPPPVPDDQNIYKAPRMTEWFVGRGANELTKRLGGGSDTNAPHLVFQDGRIRVAELTVVPLGTPVTGADAVLRPGDSENNKRVEKCLKDAVGPALEGASGYILVAQPLDRIKPAQICLEADKTPDSAALLALFPERALPLSPVIAASAGRLQIEPTGNSSFVVSFSAVSANCCAAVDYLGWSDRFEPDFAIIREALKRPYARMEGDYAQAYAQPIPNFVLVRIVAQMLSQRAQCNFLLGRPEKALSELTLLHGLSRLLEAKPTGKPMTLVAAMINVAITGLYVQTVSDGFQLLAWHEPQMIELQKQLAEINLPPQVAESFHAEQAGFLNTLMTVSPTALANQFLKLSGGKTNRWAWFKEPMSRFIALAPRGWIYQNMLVYARLHQRMGDSLDLADGQIHPDKSNRVPGEVEATIVHHRFYGYMAARAIPNYTGAVRTLGYQQTRVNEALIACALERFHLANGQYPETLAALSPQFLEKIPPDLIGGQPLKYHRTDDGRFVLYSIGWDEKDDGGTSAVLKNGYIPDNSHGDWVWPQPPAK